MSQFCYNRGCQKSFTPTKDPSKDDTACQYHPGLPYFHDAYKIWSCCQKKSHDFSTFLSIPGCQRGPHQPNKPDEPVPLRPVEQEEAAAPKPVVRQDIPKPPTPSLERPSIDAPLTKMKLIVASSLKTALEKLSPNTNTNADQKEELTNDIKPGTPCRHAACGMQYTTPDQVQATICRFHPGVPIFHEGKKQNFFRNSIKKIL
jgi:hypothetical protein